MIQFILAQSDTVDANLFYWLLGGMGLAVTSMAVFIKSIYTRAWDELNAKHNEAMRKIDLIQTTLIENTATRTEIQNDLKETKYAIQTLNTKIQCKGDKAND